MNPFAPTIKYFGSKQPGKRAQTTSNYNVRREQKLNQKQFNAAMRISQKARVNGVANANSLDSSDWFSYPQ